MYNTGCGAAECNTKKAFGNLQLADGKGKPFNKKIFDEAAKHLHEKGTVKPTIVNDKPVKDLIKETNRILNDAVNFGISDNVIPPAMLKSLQNDVYLFSGMKTYAELKTVSSLLLDEQGKRKPFSQFAADVEKIHKNYNQTYLEAEYYFATSSAQMAANWAALDDKGRYNLQYRTAGDARVRDSHNALRDTTLPPDDAFWQSYYPPNGWRCRCTAVEVSKQRYKESDSKDAIVKGDKATTAIGKDGKNALAIFRFNPGSQKIIFPPTHPYKGDLSKCGVGKLADGSGQGEKCKVAAELEKQIAQNDFKKVKDYDNGGSIEIHNLVDKTASDFKKNYAICKHHAELGEKTQILPTVKDKASSLYKSIFGALVGTKYEGKSPDNKIGENFWEHEGHLENSNPKNWLSNMLSSGVKQASRIVIDKVDFTDERIVKLIELRIKEGQKIDEVWEIDKGKIRMLYKHKTSK